jgi:hypothetical protein
MKMMVFPEEVSSKSYLYLNDGNIKKLVDFFSRECNENYISLLNEVINHIKRESQKADPGAKPKLEDWYYSLQTLKEELREIGRTVR